MKLVTIILNKTECLDEILEEFGNNNIPGATIIDSKGMVQELYDHDHEDMFFLMSLRSLLTPTHKENKTIIMVAKDEDVKVISAIVNKSTGGLDKPDTGILFTIPVDYVEGIKH
ncbi:MAG: hypothetical protein IJ025_05960 [Clostridia bacterium]|nr:hypothetical protein [Clostridia bacterium]